jgi:hypothetical protein
MVLDMLELNLKLILSACHFFNIFLYYMSKIIPFQNATLVLSTINASIINNLKTSFTFNNINLQSLLSNAMWDKYDLFNIVLVEVGSGVGPNTLGTSLDDNNVEFVMTGLPFINSRYYSQRQTIINQSVVGLLNFNRNIVTNQVYYGNNVSTFDKSSSIVNISINYNTVANETGPNSPIAFPNTCFIFKIIGITKENIGEIITDRRLNIK